jgi:hypothetical protein
MYTKIIVPATTGVANSLSLVVADLKTICIAITLADGTTFTGSGEGVVQFKADTTTDADVWSDYFDSGSLVQLSATNNAIRLSGPNVYRVRKTASANSAKIIATSEALL